MGNVKHAIASEGHQAAAKKLIALFGSQAEVARYLNVNPACVSSWLRGLTVIPLHQAEKVIEKYPKLDMLFLRPDIKKYEKYFK